MKCWFLSNSRNVNKTIRNILLQIVKNNISTGPSMDKQMENCNVGHSLCDKNVDFSSDRDSQESSSGSSTVMSESAPHWVEFFEENPWADDLKPSFKFMEHEDRLWGEEEAEGILTDHMIEAGLSFLSPCPLLYQYAMSKLKLPGKNLSKIYKLADYKYLQYIDLSRNNLDDLMSLGNLPFLMYLDVSYNNLKYVLQFTAPLNLTYVNYSNNKVSHIDDLTDFWSLIKFDLSHNDISVIEGLQNLRFLRVLDLSFNNIKRFENLSHLRLTHLYLQKNRISDYEEGDDCGIKTLQCLQYVNLDHNELKSLALFEDSISLVNISLIGNHIGEVFEMENLKTSVTLRELNLLDNAVTEWPEYRGMVISTVPSLCVLDGIPVTADQKVLAKNTFDPDIRITAARNYDLLVIMEELNNPIIEPCISPVDQPTLPIVILVGPLASMKAELVKYIAERFSNKVVLGVWHTSRPKYGSEIDGYDNHFITKDQINELAHSGAFVAFTEILGESYGLDRSEITKAFEKKSLFISHTDFVGAMALVNAGWKPHIILTMTLNEELHLQRLRKRPYISLRCNQEQCPRKKAYKEGKTVDLPRSINQYIDSLLTDSFLKNITESLQPGTSSFMEEEEILDIPWNIIDYIASQFTHELLSDTVESEESGHIKLSMVEEMKKTQQNAHKYIGSILRDLVLNEVVENQNGQGVKAVNVNLPQNTTQSVKSLIESTLLKRVTGKEKAQMDQDEKRETIKYVETVILDSLSKDVIKDQKSQMDKDEIQRIETMIKDSLCKRIAKSLRKPCHCQSEENMEEKEEIKLPKETIANIQLLVIDQISQQIAEENITNLRKEAINCIESMVTDQVTKQILEAQKSRRSTAISTDEISSILRSSTAEYIAINVLFQDSHFVGGEFSKLEENIRNDKDKEVKEKIAISPMETNKYTESSFIGRSLKQISKHEQIRLSKKKTSCPDCDFTALCVKLVLESRQLYFKLCEKNKGLFSSVIYTDDMKKASQILCKIVKDVYQSMSRSPPIFLEEHLRFKSSISDKINYYMSMIDKQEHTSEKQKPCKCDFCNHTGNDIVIIAKDPKNTANIQ